MIISTESSRSFLIGLGSPRSMEDHLDGLACLEPRHFRPRDGSIRKALLLLSLFNRYCLWSLWYELLESVWVLELPERSDESKSMRDPDESL